MSKMRQDRFPDGPVWIRTEPVTFLHAHASRAHVHEGWHQLTFALRGRLEVETEDARALVPSQGAIWVPAGVEHRELHHPPVTVRTLYVARGAMPGQRRAVRTVSVGPLLRELIACACAVGALDRRRRAQAHLVDVVLDQLRVLPDVPLRLPMPRDARARALAERIQSQPSSPSSLRDLSRGAGASLRTAERCFRAETGLSVGEWRRRFRLFHALQLLEGGASVTAAALDVGYSTVSAFTAAFTRHFGAPPSRRRAAPPA
jgi:AraC-like DNA-binding protein